jgi:hypothetical protein
MIYTEDEQQQQQQQKQKQKLELRRNLYEKRQTIQSLNISARIKKSQNEKLKETFKTLLKFIVSNLGLLIILGGYTIAGAWMFIMLEKENELTLCTEGKSNEILNVVTLKTQLINYIKNNISLSLSDLSNKDNISTANANIEQFLIGFRDQVLAIKGNYYYTGQNCLHDSKWNFPNVLLFTVSFDFVILVIMVNFK